MTRTKYCEIHPNRRLQAPPDCFPEERSTARKVCHVCFNLAIQEESQERAPLWWDNESYIAYQIRGLDDSDYDNYPAPKWKGVDLKTNDYCGSVFSHSFTCPKYTIDEPPF